MTAGLCALCHRQADPAVVTGEVHADSGPGWVEYAHPECEAERQERLRLARAEEMW